MKKGVSLSERHRAERRASLRELLSKQGHLQHINELLEDLQDLDEEMDSVKVQRLSKVIDTKLKLINKYLADDKEPTNVNLGGQEDNPVKAKIERVIV